MGNERSAKILHVFSPINGVINQISNLNDGVFSEGLLGEGCFIIPKNIKQTFNSPLNNAKYKQNSETKHAHYIESQEIIGLLHIGLDSIKLNGNGFNVLSNIEDNLDIDSQIVEVDFKYFEEQKIDNSSILVFDLKENKKIDKIKFLFKNGDEVSKNQPIIEIIIKDNLNKITMDEIIGFEDKYQVSAKKIFEAVGERSNYTRVFNCTTRMRFNIVDKSKVKIDKLKSIQLIKGTHWNGDELQLIVGADVLKLKNSYDKYYSLVKKGLVNNFDINNKEKTTKRTAILGAIAGIMQPTIPLLMIFGMLMGIYALLTQFNILSSVDFAKNKPSLIGGVTYSVAQLGMTFVGLAFIISTVNYFKGNVIIAAFIGIALVNPMMIAYNISWKLFSIANHPISVTAYNNSVLPLIVAGLLYVFIDNWIKKWMPGTIDIVFRPLLSFVITVLFIFFVFGPIVKLVEVGMSKVVLTIGDIPYGIGVGVFSLLFQPLVLTGMHQIILSTLFIDLIANNAVRPSYIYLGVIISTFAQIGAGIGCGIATKQKAMRSATIAALPAALLGGVTEPIIYGVTLPTVKPFVCGTIAAGIAGVVSGILRVGRWDDAAGGLFHITGYVRGGTWNIIAYCIVLTVATLMSILFVMLTFIDRKKEKSQLMKQIKIFTRILGKSGSINSNNKTEMIAQIKKYKKLLSKEDEKLINNYEKNLIKIKNMETNISLIGSKEQEYQKNLSNKIIKINKSKKKIDINLISDKWINNKFNKKILNYNKELLNYTDNIEVSKREYNRLIENKIKTIRQLDTFFFDKLKIDKDLKNKYDNSVYNALFSLEIYYKIKNPNNDILTYKNYKKEYNNPTFK